MTEIHMFVDFLPETITADTVASGKIYGGFANLPTGKDPESIQAGQPLSFCPNCPAFLRKQCGGMIVYRVEGETFAMAETNAGFAPLRQEDAGFAPSRQEDCMIPHSVFVIESPAQSTPKETSVA